MRSAVRTLVAVDDVLGTVGGRRGEGLEGEAPAAQLARDPVGDRLVLLLGDVVIEGGVGGQPALEREHAVRAVVGEQQGRALVRAHHDDAVAGGGRSPGERGGGHALARVPGGDDRRRGLHVLDGGVVLRPAGGPQLDGELRPGGRVDGERDGVQARVDRQDDGDVAVQRIALPGARRHGADRGERAGGRDRRVRREVVRVGGPQADHRRILPSKRRQQQIEVVAAERPRRDAPPRDERRGGPGGLALGRAGGHHARRPERDVGCGDVAAGEEQVLDVARVQAAVGDAVGAGAVALLRTGTVGVDALDGVQVDRPAAEGHRIREVHLVEDVVLRERVVADEAAVLALAGQGADPLQRQVLGIEVAGVLDVVPDAEDHAPELVADALVLGDGVELAAPLDPPVVAAVVAGADDPVGEDGRAADVLGDARRHEPRRAAGVLRVEEQRAAEQFVVGLLRRPLLAVLGARFAADAVLGAREVADQAVAGAVEEDGRLEGGLQLASHRPAGHGADRVAVLVHPDGADVRVEVQREVGLRAHEIEDDMVPVVRVALRVAVLVLEEQFAHDPGLAGEALGAVRGRADDPHPHLAGRVAAEHGPVRDESDRGPQPSGGDGRRDPGQPSADDDDVCTARALLHAPTVSLSGKAMSLDGKNVPRGGTLAPPIRQ